MEYLFQTDLPDLSLIKGKLPSFSDINRTSLKGEKRKNYSPVSFLLAPSANHHVEEINTNTPREVNETVFSRDTVVK